MFLKRSHLIILLAMVALVAVLIGKFALSPPKDDISRQATEDANTALVAADKAAVSARKAADSTKRTAEQAARSARDSAESAKDASTSANKKPVGVP